MLHFVNYYFPKQQCQLPMQFNSKSRVSKSLQDIKARDGRWFEPHAKLQIADLSIVVSAMQSVYVTSSKTGNRQEAVKQETTEDSLK